MKLQIAPANPWVEPVPQGSASASFSIDTTTILSASSVVITATANGVTQSATLTIIPPPNIAILSIQIDPANVIGGNSATGTVTLTAPAPNGGSSVTLVSSQPSVASAPSSVTVRKGDTTATFTINTSSVTASQSATNSGTFGGLTQRDTENPDQPSDVRLCKCESVLTVPRSLSSH